ncbi:unnamed protein product [Bursaphelenchus xylophilus]|uniref:(pine wood nematode) hypothetical protein n=1 Tax=Bursaphelenchus xylophilus TaxID=6326 RepID=A0A1I7S026_BURXY|nr:unnamed protein product [Bursaphelenchus xylophilus]CAG9109064.1 unnamed protein product [Bursaphelenchus xylophilus]
MKLSKEQKKAAENLGKWRQKFKSRNDMHEILPGLYLGSYSAAINRRSLEAANISAVLSIMTTSVKKEKQIKYKQIHLEDDPSSDLSKHFEECINFIHFYRVANRNVLVHCLMGVSRSATIVIAYIMAITKLDPFDVIGFVTSRRDFINPNEGFLEQLKIYKAKCNETHKELQITHERVKDDHFQLVERDLKVVNEWLAVAKDGNLA